MPRAMKRAAARQLTKEMQKQIDQVASLIAAVKAANVQSAKPRRQTRSLWGAYDRHAVTLLHATK